MLLVSRQGLLLVLLFLVLLLGVVLALFRDQREERGLGQDSERIRPAPHLWLKTALLLLLQLPSLLRLLRPHLLLPLCLLGQLELYGQVCLLGLVQRGGAQAQSLQSSEVLEGVGRRGGWRGRWPCCCERRETNAALGARPLCRGHPARHGLPTVSALGAQRRS